MNCQTDSPVKIGVIDIEVGKDRNESSWIVLEVIAWALRPLVGPLGGLVIGHVERRFYTSN